MKSIWAYPPINTFYLAVVTYFAVQFITLVSMTSFPLISYLCLCVWQAFRAVRDLEEPKNGEEYIISRSSGIIYGGRCYLSNRHVRAMADTKYFRAPIHVKQWIITDADEWLPLLNRALFQLLKQMLVLSNILALHVNKFIISCYILHIYSNYPQ